MKRNSKDNDLLGAFWVVLVVIGILAIFYFVFIKTTKITNVLPLPSDATTKDSIIILRSNPATQEAKPK